MNMTVKYVRESLGDVYSLPTVAKFVVRVQLGFSQTYSVQFDVKPEVCIIDDEKSPSGNGK